MHHIKSGFGSRCGTILLVAVFCILPLFGGGNALADEAAFAHHDERLAYKRGADYINAGFRHDGDNCAVDQPDGQLSSSSALTIAPDSFSYSVTGTGCGHNVYGVIDVDGVGGVSGYLYLENGKEVSFYGDWVGDGVAEGVDNDGNLYTVQVDN